MHEVLRHLEAVGYPHSPRVLGIDERNREILTYLPGVAIYRALEHRLEDLDFVTRAGAFVAELHAALPEHDDGALTLHGDLGTWNVLVDGERWSVIDWDSISRGTAEWEVA